MTAYGMGMGESGSHCGLKVPCPKLGTTPSCPCTQSGSQPGTGPKNKKYMHLNLVCDSYQVFMCTCSPPNAEAGYHPEHFIRSQAHLVGYTADGLHLSGFWEANLRSFCHLEGERVLVILLSYYYFQKKEETIYGSKNNKYTLQYFSLDSYFSLLS